MKLTDPAVFGPLMVLVGVLVTQAVTFFRERKKDDRTHLRETTTAEHQRVMDDNARIVSEREQAQEDAREQRHVARDAQRDRENYRRLYEHSEAKNAILERALYVAGLSLPDYPPVPVTPTEGQQ